MPRRPCQLLPALGPADKRHWGHAPLLCVDSVVAEFSWLLRQDPPFAHTAHFPSSWLGVPLCFRDQNHLVSLLSGRSSLKWSLYWHPVTGPNPSVAGHTGPSLPPGPASPACCAALAGGPPQTLLSPCMPSPQAFSSSLPKGHSPSYSQHCGNRCHTAVPQGFSETLSPPATPGKSEDSCAITTGELLLTSRDSPNPKQLSSPKHEAEVESACPEYLYMPSAQNGL